MKKCTGENCPMQMGYDFENCAAIEKCPYRTRPVMKSFETMCADDFCSYGKRKDGGDG